MVIGVYLEDVKAARVWLKAQSSLPPSDVEDVPPISQLDLLKLIEVPKVEIDVFSGDPLHYQTFMAIFREAVDGKISDGQTKLTRLLQYTEGAAKAAIRNCALIGGERGYRQAQEVLKQRFGNPHLISQSIITSLTLDVRYAKQWKYSNSLMRSLLLKWH